MGQYREVSEHRNLLGYSESLAGNWGERGGTEVITSNDTIAPDGTLTADKVTGLDVIYVDDIWHTVASIEVPDNDRVEPSVWIKRISTSGILRIIDPMGGGGSAGQWEVDLSRLSDRWEPIDRYNYAVSVNVEFLSDNAATPNTGLHLHAQSGGPLAFYLWGTQVVPGTEPKPYIKSDSGGTTLGATKRENHWAKDHNGIWRRTILLEGARTNVIQYSAGPFHDSPGGLDFWDQFWTISAYENVPSCVAGGHALRATSTLDGAPRINYQTGTFSGNVEVISGIFERGDNNLNCLIGAWGNPTGTNFLNSGYTFGTGSHYATGYGTAVVVDYGKEELGTGPNGGEMIRMWVAYDTSVSGFVGESRYNQWRLDSQFSGYGDGILHHAQLETDADFPTSPIVTVGASNTRNVEDFSIPFTAVPQELTAYCRFTEGENVITGTRIWDVGGTTSGILCTRTNGYAFQHFDSGGPSNSWSGSGDVQPGRTVELRCLLASDGAAQIGTSFNGGAETVATAGSAVAFGGNWGDSLFHIGIGQSGAFPGHANFDSLKVVKGTKSMEFMRGYRERG